MAVVKNKSTEKNREFWSHVERISEQIDQEIPRTRVNDKSCEQDISCDRDEQDGQQHVE